MAKKLTFEQLEKRARAKLAKAVARGRRDEQQTAKLELANLVRGKKRADAKAAEALAPAPQPAAAPAPEEQAKQQRSEASKKGWQTRKLRDKFTGDTFGVDEEGFLPELRKRIKRNERDNYRTILRQYTLGKRVFGPYQVCEPDQAEFWIGVVVWTEPNGDVEYRYTPRELSYSDAYVNVQALQTTYKAKNKVIAIVPLRRFKGEEESA